MIADLLVDALDRLHFAAGFFGVQSYLTDYHQLIAIEASGFNNTLSPYEICQNANNAIASYGGTQANKWAAIYLQDAVNRLQRSITGFTLNTSMLIAMQELCAYEVRLLATASPDYWGMTQS
jgi:hypothetical protein